MKKLILATALVLNALALPLNKVAAQEKDTEPESFKDRTSLVVSAGSYHIGQRTFYDNGEQRHFNEFNPGFGLEYRLNDKFHLVACAYRNSIYNTSVYAGAGYETDGSKFLGFGVDAGIVTGYELPVAPAVVPYLRIGPRNDRFNVKLNVIPPVKGVTPAVVALQARISLGKS